jgi:hypothetical protein
VPSGIALLTRISDFAVVPVVAESQSAVAGRDFPDRDGSGKNLGPSGVHRRRMLPRFGGQIGNVGLRTFT